MIEQLMDRWDSKVRQTTTTFELLGTRCEMLPVAPGRNRVIYLLGHLLAVQDHLYDALELGDAMYPELDYLFLLPQHTSNDYPPFEELLCKWVCINDLILLNLKMFQVEDWLKKHRYITEKEFCENPCRNKFNLILSSIFHLYHHGGQLALIKEG